MRDNTAVILFILIILFILASYVIAALYFDGFMNMIDEFLQTIGMIGDIIMTVLEAIYETFIA